MEKSEKTTNKIFLIISVKSFIPNRRIENDYVTLLNIKFI